MMSCRCYLKITRKLAKFAGAFCGCVYLLFLCSQVDLKSRLFMMYLEPDIVFRRHPSVQVAAALWDCYKFHLENDWLAPVDDDIEEDEYAQLYGTGDDVGKAPEYAIRLTWGIIACQVAFLGERWDSPSKPFLQYKTGNRHVPTSAVVAKYMLRAGSLRFLRSLIAASYSQHSNAWKAVSVAIMSLFEALESASRVAALSSYLHQLEGDNHAFRVVVDATCARVSSVTEAVR
jgi:hypothetical protein